MADVRLRNAYLEEMDMRKQLLLSTGILCLMLTPAVSYGQGPGERRDEPKQMRPAESGKGAASQERGAEHAQGRSQERTQERSQGAEQHAQGASGRDDKGTSSRQFEEKDKAGPSNERPATASDDKRGRGEDTKSSEGARDSRHGDSNRDDARGKSAEQEKSKAGTTSAQKEREGISATQKDSARDQREGTKNAAEQSKGNNNRDSNNRDNNRPSTATDTTRTPPSTNAQNAPAGSTSQTQTSQRSNIAVDKQVRISETFKRERLAAPERDLNVSIRVGERVPERVRIHRLPDTIVSIEPEYRDYDYFTTDDEIVIVEPRTHQVVSQFPRDASRLRAAEGTGGSSGTSGYTGTVAAAGGASRCRIMRRDTAGNVTELTPQTVGSAAQQDTISVTVRVPGGATTAPISMGAPDGQIVVSGQSGADCTVTIEPPPAR